MDSSSGHGKGVHLADERKASRGGIRGMPVRSRSLLQILEDEDEIRYDRIQEARGRIARRYYDQEDIRKEISRALLVLLGHRGP